MNVALGIIIQGITHGSKCAQAQAWLGTTLGHATRKTFLSCFVLIYFPSSAKDAQHMADVENCKLQFCTPPPHSGVRIIYLH